MTRILVYIITVYQKLISPMRPPSCRFHPSCSNYCKEALIQYGSLIGIYLAVKRLLKCHPYHPGGYDPVK